MESLFLKKILPHLLAVLLFVVLSVSYNTAILEGKRLNQQDSQQALGTAKQSKEYYEKTKELPFWSPQTFSGMPSYMIYMNYDNSLPVHIGRFLVNILPEPANLYFLYMLGAYIAMLLLGFNPWISVLAAVGYAFSSYNIINIGAGHISKAIAVATIPPLVASVVYTYKSKKYLLGGVLVMFFSAVHQYSNFVQMTYYIAFSLGLYALWELVQAVRNKQQKSFWIASGVILAAGGISIATHYSRYVVLSEYTAQTTRGKSELSDEVAYVLNPESKKDKKGGTKKSKNGLSSEYAFGWSYGKVETMNLFIPNFYGGSSSGIGGENEKDILKTDTYKVVSKVAGEDAGRQLGASVGYWGEQPGTGGPAYMGAMVILLAIFGFVASKNNLKWWLAGSFLFFLSIAWGSNFVLNEFWFSYLPLFNKFRAVTMILSIAPLFLVTLAALGLFEVFKTNSLEENLRQNQYEILFKNLKTTAVISGILFAGAILGMILFDFKSQNDVKMFEYLKNALQDEIEANKIMQAMRSDRKGLLQADTFRSFMFVIIGLGLLWAFIRKYMSAKILVTTLTLLTILDLWLVDKRYLNNSSFVSKSQALKIPLLPVNEQIMKDTTHYRVLNFTVSPFNDATTSYYHNSVGGYHAAKLGRYQEMIDAHIARQNMSVWNMLNIKYLIVEGQKGGEQVQQNPNALGNAWFVKEFKMVANADEELKSLSNFNPKEKAFVDKRFEKQLSSQFSALKIQPDSNATIRLTINTPNKMVYTTSALTPQLAVFSEMYYLTPQSGWKAFIDGKFVEHLRTNYVLRGVVVPAGKHTVEFRFDASSYQNAEKMNLWISILFALIIAAGITFEILSDKKNDKNIAS